MLTGAMVLKRAMVLGMLALPTISIAAVSLPAPAALAAPSVPGRSCTTEDWVWTGGAELDPSSSFGTGVVVPPIDGTELVVVGVSADGIAPTGRARSMPVTVGGVRAVPGAAVPGGEVVVLADGAGGRLDGVTVTLERCGLVQQSPSAPEPSSAASPGELPGTGLTVDGSLLGMAAIAVGSAMIVAGRRRTA